MKSPSTWEPTTYAEIIGHAGTLAKVIQGKIKRMKADGDLNARWLFAGPPGIGKSALAKIAALDLAGGENLAIERKSGLVVTVETVKGWINSLGMGSLFGGHQVKLVEEMDRVPPAAQDLMLDYLDRSKGMGDLVFIGTSNADMSALQERFSTRLQYWKLAGPSQDDIEELLSKWSASPARTGVGIATIKMIAAGACGNVRQALLDLESQIDVNYALAA
jgi:replication-associated recombination protein RarA